MLSKQELRRAQVMVHNAEKLTKRHLNASLYPWVFERFDYLIKTLDRLATGKAPLHPTKRG